MAGVSADVRDPQTMPRLVSTQGDGTATPLALDLQTGTLHLLCDSGERQEFTLTPYALGIARIAALVLGAEPNWQADMYEALVGMEGPVARLLREGGLAS